MLLKSPFKAFECPFSVDERRIKEHKDDIYSNKKLFLLALKTILLIERVDHSYN